MHQEKYGRSRDTRAGLRRRKQGCSRPVGTKLPHGVQDRRHADGATSANDARVWHPSPNNPADRRALKVGGLWWLLIRRPPDRAGLGPPSLTLPPKGALLISLDELRARACDIPTAKPVVVVCQTGRRSGLGAAILAKAGVPRVASLAGGMVRWHELGLPS